MKTKMASYSEALAELDHPEILSRERLAEILSQRCLPESEIRDLEKCELVNLFYKFVSPLPQRTQQLKRTKRVPDGTMKTAARAKRRCEDNHGNPGINNKMAKLDLSWVTVNKYKSKSPSNLSTKVNDSSADINIKNSSDTAQPKVVKLNRRSLGLNVKKSVKCVEDKQCSNMCSTAEQTEGRLDEKEISTPVVETNGEDSQAKKKFKKVLVTWP